MYRSRLRAAWWPILTIRALPPLPRTVISRCRKSTSLRRGSSAWYRMPASSASRMPVARNTAMIAASRRCANVRPVQACSSLDSSSPVKTGTSFSVTRRLQPGHRVGQLVFGGQPFEELLQGAVLVAGVGVAVTVQQPRHPPLDR